MYVEIETITYMIFFWFGEKQKMICVDVIQNIFFTGNGTKHILLKKRYMKGICEVMYGMKENTWAKTQGKTN